MSSATSAPNPTNARPTIPARPHRLGKALVYRLLVRPACTAQFAGIHLRVEGALPDPANGPLIAYLNHPGWWDGYMAFLLDREVLRERFQSFVMMEERQLRAFRFFTWCGAFSVDRNQPGGAEASVRYISQLLRERADRMLWIMPQGRILPNDQRPLRIYPGVARIALNIGNAQLCPVAVRYEYLGEQRADAFIRVGPIHSTSDAPDVRRLTRVIAERLTTAVDTLRSEVLDGRTTAYQTLLRGRPGIDRLTAGLLDRLFGGARHSTR